MVIDMPLRQFTDEQEARIAALYQEGASMIALATRFDCTDMTIRNVLDRTNVPLRQRKFNKDLQCIHQGCPHKRKAGKHCPGHWNQFQRTGRTWNIGPVAKRKSLEETITGFLKEQRIGFNERIQERLNAQQN